MCLCLISSTASPSTCAWGGVGGGAMGAGITAVAALSLGAPVAWPALGFGLIGSVGGIFAGCPEGDEWGAAWAGAQSGFRVGVAGGSGVAASGLRGSGTSSAGNPKGNDVDVLNGNQIFNEVNQVREINIR